MSDEYTLVILDTPGIQRYIFGSNRLRENIGASHLVHLASTRWPLEILSRWGKGSNVTKRTLKLNDSLRIEEGTIGAEVLYVGGGNVVALFRDEEEAKTFLRKWSEKVIAEAPGLTPIAIYTPYTWGENLSHAIDRAKKALKQARQSTPPFTPLLGMGVTVEGSSTGKPAVVRSKKYGDPRDRPVSAEVAAKLSRVREANERLHALLPEEKRNAYTFAEETDHFGRRRGEMSYLAIVHADGNGIGERFRKLGKDRGNAREYIQAVRSLSRRLHQAADQATRKLIERLLNSSERINSVKNNHSILLPFRPIIFGGDDFTFISDGPLGLPLATLYLKLFEEAVNREGSPITASAGVAIVKVHYPFARAYRLSEELTANAKNDFQRQCSALDWHIVSGGMLASLDEIRQRSYTVSAGQKKLYVRPLALHDQHCDNFPRWRNWERFVKVLKGFQEIAEEHRNKVMTLREKLRGGPDEAALFLQRMGQSKDKLSWGEDVSPEGGWIRTQDGQSICLYFDPIEAMDFYVEV